MTKAQRISEIKDKLFIFNGRDLSEVKTELLKGFNEMNKNNPWNKEFMRKINLIDEYVRLTGSTTMKEQTGLDDMNAAMKIVDDCFNTK